MSQDGDFADSDKSDFSQKLTPNQQILSMDKEISLSSLLNKQGFEPPRQLPKRSYSLEPDLATGWKPKKIGGNILNNVFPLNFSCEVIDYLIKQLYRRKSKQYQIAYLGPRKINSYMLHQNRKYQNPYPPSKKLDSHLTQRPQIPLNPIFEEKNLKFNSNFECGNLDAAIFISSNEYDLFMRVDTNTKGHTNWYYFTAAFDSIFATLEEINLCTKEASNHISFQRKPVIHGNKAAKMQDMRKDHYDIIFCMKMKIILGRRLKTYNVLTFTYHFEIPNDTVELAYFIPYSYSRLLKFIPTLQNCKSLPPLKSLSGLSIPVLEITDEEAESQNKKVLILTGRIHPGEANGSFVCQGFLQYICSEELKAKQFRKNFIAYIVPMINPDGVVAGNYRTSLFGKDLNRTFNQSRKFAFPQTFHLLQLIKDLKAKYKQRMNLFIDLHGHSVKKNIFMYGPQFNIQHPNYYLAKQLPKILSTLTPCFRYYSCIFRISSEKSTTARATLNRFLGIPFTYTMQSSNGFYYDSEIKKQMQLTSKKLKKIGMALCQAMIMFKQIQNSKSNTNFALLASRNTTRKMSQIDTENQEILLQKQLPQKLTETKQKQQKIKFMDDLSESDDKNILSNYHQLNHGQIPKDEIHSDDNISEGNSDSEPADQDLSDSELDKLLETIQQGRQNVQRSPQKNFNHHGSFLSPILQQSEAIFKLSKFSSRPAKQKSRYKKKNPLLPPINCLNRALAKQKVTKSFVQKGETTFTVSPQKQRRSKHLSVSQMIEDAKGDLGTLTILKKDEMSLAQTIMKKKISKLELEKVKFFSNSPYSNSKH